MQGGFLPKKRGAVNIAIQIDEFGTLQKRGDQLFHTFFFVDELAHVHIVHIRQSMNQIQMRTILKDLFDHCESLCLQLSVRTCVTLWVNEVQAWERLRSASFVGGYFPFLIDRGLLL